MNIRHAAVAAAGALTAAVLVITPAGAAPARETADQSRSVPVQAWWGQVKADYASLTADISAIGSSVGSVAQLHSLAEVTAACQKVVTDSKVLLKMPPAPVKRVNAAWQAGLHYVEQGASVCVKGTAPQTTKLIEQAGHDLEKGRAKLGSARGQISKLTTTGS